MRSIEVEHHGGLVAVPIFRTCDAVLPDFHRKIFLFNGPETHFLKKGRRESERKYLRNLFAPRFFDECSDERATSASNRLFGRCGEAINLSRFLRILVESAASDDLSVHIGDEVVR